MDTTSLFYIETHSHDPHYNLALEEYVLTHRKEGTYLLLWQNDNAIILGQYQNAEAEIDRAFVDSHGIQVVRRITGGGAVYHDLGNLNYSFITDTGDAALLTYEQFTKPVVDALRKLGLDAEASGRNDILVNGKKVSGTAQRLSGERILHHGTLLFDSDMAVLSHALKVDPEKIKAKGIASVRSRVTNIRAELAKDMTLDAFWSHLKTAFSENALQPIELTAEELAAVETLKQEKYDTWQWNFGRSPACEMHSKRRFDGGTVELYMHMEKGRIAEISFLGDFLSMASIDPLTDALKGCRFTQDEVGAVLEQHPLSRYFGAISKEELLSLMF